MFGFVSSLEGQWLFVFCFFISNNYCRWGSFITNCHGSDFMRSLSESCFTSIWNVGICSRHWEHDKSMPFRINV